MADPRVGIVGCGLIGKKRLLSLGSDQVKFVCDINERRAAELAGLSKGTRVLVNPDQAVEDPEVDVLFIAVPNAGLAPLGIKALRAGKHVLLEKPAGISSSEIKGLQLEAKKNRRLVRVGYNHRYHPAFLKLQAVVKTEDVGPLMFLRARYGHGGRVGYDHEWRADKKISGGGELIDQGVHLIDLAYSLMGDFSLIKGEALTYFWNMDVDDNAFLHLKNAAGQTAWLHASCSEWKNTFSFEVYFKNAKFHVEGLGGSYGVEKLYHYKMLPEMGPPETVIYEFPRGDASWKVEMNEFFEDIRLGREPVPGLKEAEVALKVVEEIYRTPL